MKWGAANIKQDKAQHSTPHAIQRGRFLCPPMYDKISDNIICDISFPLSMKPKKKKNSKNH
jgi:hypothetical protein